MRDYVLLAMAAMLVNGPALPDIGAAYRRLGVAPSSAPPAPPPPSAHAISASKGDDGLFRVTGLVGGQRVRFVVDTGASTTVLSARDASRLSLGPAGRPAGQLRTAAGTAPMSWRHLSRLDIAGTHVPDLDVAVMRQGLAHSLLGQDILAKLGTITLAGERLEIRPSRS